jgi:hypothetical protein
VIWRKLIESAWTLLERALRIPDGPQLPVFTHEEWCAKWRRYVESKAREMVKDAERPYVFQTWIGKSAESLAFIHMELSPAIMTPPMVMARGMIPVPKRPPLGTRAELDALVAVLSIKLHEMIYILDNVAPGSPLPENDTGYVN